MLLRLKITGVDVIELICKPVPAGWKRIVRAVEEVQRTEPAPVETTQ